MIGQLLLLKREVSDNKFLHSSLLHPQKFIKVTPQSTVQMKCITLQCSMYSKVLCSVAWCSTIQYSTAVQHRISPPGGTRYLSIWGFRVNIWGLRNCKKSYIGSVNYNFGKFNIWGLSITASEKCNVFALRNESKAEKTKAQSFCTVNIIMTRLSQMLRHSMTFYDSDSPKYLTTFRVSKF